MTAKTEPTIAAVTEARTVTVPKVGEETLPCSMRDLLLYFLRLGTFGFGGPIALALHMQRDLVEQPPVGFQARLSRGARSVAAFAVSGS